MYLEITISNIEGKRMTGIFHNEEQIPMKTVRFGAEGYVDYTVPPHDAEKARYI